MENPKRKLERAAIGSLHRRSSWSSVSVVAQRIGYRGPKGFSLGQETFEKAHANDRLDLIRRGCHILTAQPRRLLPSQLSPTTAFKNEAGRRTMPEDCLPSTAMENEESSSSRTLDEPSTYGLSILADPEEPTLE